jgi:DNA (cytosine-5)-methyltransferase 1
MSRGIISAVDEARLIAGLEWVKYAKWPSAPNGKSPVLSLVDLFSGCGGMTLGVWEAARLRHRKVSVRLAVDSADEPMAVYRANFDITPNRARVDDVGRIFSGKRGRPLSSVERYWVGRARQVDLIVAGPPCQGHSDLNNSTRRKDPRNALYLRVSRAAEILRPKAIIIENVPAVLHDKNRVVQEAIDWLKRLDYQVVESVVKLTHFGIPQHRKRHILVAVLGQTFTFPNLESKPTSILTAGQFLDGLEDEPDERTELFYRPSRMTDANLDRVEYLFDHRLHDLPDAERPSCHRDKDHAYVSMYGRMHWDRPAQTLTSGFGSMGQGRYVHPRRRRLLTPHEAARLQGFPDFFDFSPARKLTHLREMIANAVPPQLLGTLVTRLIDDGTL